TRLIVALLLPAALVPAARATGPLRPAVPAGENVHFRDDFQDTSGLEEATNLHAQDGLLRVADTVTWRQDNWEDFYPGRGSGIDLFGGPGSIQLSTFSPDVRVNAVAAGLQSQVDAAFVYVPAEGGRDLEYILAVWADGRNGDLDIYFSRSGDGGQTWSTNRRLNPIDNAGDQRHPAIAVLANTLHVVWEDDAGIHYTRSTDYGQTWLTDVLLVPGGADPDLGAAYLSPYPTVYLAYRAEQSPGDPDIFAQRSRDGGVYWDPPENVIQEPPNGTAQGAPSILIDPRTGSVWVAWEHVAPDGQTDIRAAHRMAGGIWPNEEVATGPTGTAQHDPVLFLSGEDVRCLWTDERGTTSDIYHARYDMMSLGWVELGPVTMDAGARKPAAIPLGSSAYAAWTATSLGVFPEIWLASSSGNAWQIPVHAGDAIPYLTRTDIALAQSSLAPGIAALWSDDRADAGDVFVATSDGTFRPTGTYTSTVHDFGDLLAWGTIHWTGLWTDHIAVETRSGNTPTPDATWSPWAPAWNGSPVPSPLARYLQYRVTLTRVDPQTTPILSWIEIQGQPRRGEGVSIPIGRCVAQWADLTYDGWTPSGTTLTVNVLDISGTLLYADVPSPFDLSSLPPETHRRLRLQLEMERQQGTSPLLDWWEVAWEQGETQAAFEMDPRSIYTPTIVEFLNRSTSTVPPEEIQWEFGDGETSGLLHPTHTYALPGTYGVTLTLSGECGTAIATDRLTVHPLPTQAPQAAFSYSALCPGTEVAFNDESRDAVWWHWD
ncbi:MAG: PKD domain-containing protein, partial [Chloroflexia bacterium]